MPADFKTSKMNQATHCHPFWHPPPPKKKYHIYVVEWKTTFRLLHNYAK
jgi:hypothetical protein